MHFDVAAQSKCFGETETCADDFQSAEGSCPSPTIETASMLFRALIHVDPVGSADNECRSLNPVSNPFSMLGWTHNSCNNKYLNCCPILYRHLDNQAVYFNLITLQEHELVRCTWCTWCCWNLCLPASRIDQSKYSAFCSQGTWFLMNNT